MSEFISHDRVLINAATALNDASASASVLSVSATGPNTDETKVGEYSATLVGDGVEAAGSVVITYNRLNVGDVLAAANIDQLAVRAHVVTGEQIAQLIRDRLGINILASDLSNEQYWAGEGRSTVDVEVRSYSKLFSGTFQVVIDAPYQDVEEGFVELINTGREPLVPEEDITPGYQSVGHTLNITGETKANGQMNVGTGNSAAEFTTISNGELNLSVSSRIWKAAPSTTDEGGVYQHELLPTQDWNVPFSFALVDGVAVGKKITDIYDITFTWTYVETEQSIVWKLKEFEGNLILEAADGMRIVDNSVQNEGRVVQNIQHMTHYVENQGNQYFTPVATTDIGGVLGSFNFEVRAVRKNSLALPLELLVSAHAYYPEPA